MKDQSRQVIETEGSALENKAVEWGRRSPHAIPKQHGPAALGPAIAKMAMSQAKMKDQSRQVIETKESASGKQSRGVGAGDHIAIPKQQGLAALGRAMAKMAIPQAGMKMKATILLKTNHRRTVARASRPCRAMAKIAVPQPK